MSEAKIEFCQGQVSLAVCPTECAELPSGWVWMWRPEPALFDEEPGMTLQAYNEERDLSADTARSAWWQEGQYDDEDDGMIDEDPVPYRWFVRRTIVQVYEEDEEGEVDLWWAMSPDSDITGPRRRSRKRATLDCWSLKHWGVPT